MILSCNTGAGHNSCAKAIQEVYQSRGDMCDIYDALLFISKRASKFISNWHTRIYLHAPKIFSSGYEKAEEKDDLFREGTPVYKYITSGADRMYDYIVSGGYDNVICTDAVQIRNYRAEGSFGRVVPDINRINDLILKLRVCIGCHLVSSCYSIYFAAAIV